MSLDGAKSWQLAEIHRACAPNAYGKHWAWVHWELRVPICKSSHAEHQFPILRAPKMQLLRSCRMEMTPTLLLHTCSS